MARGKKQPNGVAVDGQWIAVPVSFLASRACAELSPLASKMLLLLMGELRSNHFGNGRLDAHADRLRRYGWTSKESARAALRELEEASLIVRTQQGHKGQMSLFGVTLFPMHCEPRGLDVGPGAWRVSDWRENVGAELPPTDESPAQWRRPRGGEKRNPIPRSGGALPECAPVAGEQMPPRLACSPVAGPQTQVSTGNAPPWRVPPMRDAIYRRQHLGRMAVALAKRTACRATHLPAYVTARAARQPWAMAA